ncbi:mitochondrial import receptor subunit TOM40 homolog [Plodia interpunctella]|uniref:mitochondrial import receptor subunit TOM40 homolog n=1 Tax=Plodia interpunctella TaxID=58824 RepID=UPI00236765C7|nr:mitochondrial import receptor subunit TOM40 homolog [Plodia interpunctella]
MDLNETNIKEEVSNFMSSFQKLLPKKKQIITLDAPKQNKMIRLNDMHAEAKSVFPLCFTGAKVVIMREVMNRVKLVQQYNYGRTKETYKAFTHLLYKEMEPKAIDEGLLVDSAGSATATYTEDLDGGYTMQLTSKIRDLISSETEIVFDRENQKSVASVSCSMKDVDPNTLRLVTQWVYKVIPEFCFGSEVSFRPMLYPPLPDVSVTARYDRQTFTLSGTISKAGFQACLFKQFTPDLRIATIVNEDAREARTTIGLGMHKKYSNGSELKVFVDSQRSGGFTFQKDVLFYEPHNEIRVLRLIGSTLIDKQRRVRFGFGFELDF